MSYYHISLIIIIKVIQHVSLACMVGTLRDTTEVSNEMFALTFRWGPCRIFKVYSAYYNKFIPLEPVEMTGFHAVEAHLEIPPALSIIFNISSL